ncbi:hypothetical protein JOY44_00365 [Phormidium sp. CLA17]|uniref:hypothetical protein n=1 Tax=Leptolyngbya sp. Cla-17 TaxID=2803751 RepID=UPI0014920B61|nr:hypothetical protein [Leptolyngbya sp. Cla-17]MBM0740109.1 hypothetical protein [Leptolyngbya sp. Cla-17]
MVGKQSNPFELTQPDSSSNPVELEEESSQLTVSLEKINRSPVPSLWSRMKSWRWLLVSVSIFCVVGSISAAALWLLTTPPPSADCQKISALSTDMEQLYCAQEAARTGKLPKLLAGMDTLNQWTPDHPLYREAQRLIAEWSQPVLTAARDRIAQSDLTGAVELASSIPKTSPLYPEAQANITKWQRFWQKGEAIATATKTALKAQQWEIATAKIGLLREFTQDYWRYERPNALTQQLESEQRSRRYFAQAQDVATLNQPEQLGAAIAVASRMDTTTYAWIDAQKLLSQWSETLLSLSYQNWVKGQLAQSMALARLVLPNPNLTQTAQDLIWLAQARSHSLDSRTTLKPTLPQLWNLTAAIATADLLQPASRYYPQAQANLKSWKAQLQDFSLLQLGWAVGSLPHPQAIQLALWQGQQIASDRPRRAQAQTLVAYWQQELLKSEDLPYLAYARKLAEKRSIPALQAAIAQATVIKAGRPLHPEAQTFVAAWTGNIQTIQDQPILDRAWALASQGDLNGAIQAAAEIAPKRSLYEQAQGAIYSWQAEIRAAEIARIQAQEAAIERSRRSLKETPLAQPDERFPSNSEDLAPEDENLPADEPLTPEDSGSGAPYQPYTPPPRRPFTYPSPDSALPPPVEPAPPPTEPAPPVYEPYEPAPPPVR